MLDEDGFGRLDVDSVIGIADYGAVFCVTQSPNRATAPRLEFDPIVELLYPQTDNNNIGCSNSESINANTGIAPVDIHIRCAVVGWNVYRRI
ncbi:MAG: hypothetical protein AB7F75_11160 [Planctomycetota bacterium]